MTLLALWSSAARCVLALFVLPHWTDYRFYNWQMSVTRKPVYDLALRSSIASRGFRSLHDIFTRMWFKLVVGVAAAWGSSSAGARLRSAERLLRLWIASERSN